MSNIIQMSYGDIFASQVADISFKDIIESSEKLVLDLKPLSSLHDKESYTKLAEMLLNSFFDMETNKRDSVMFIGDKYDVEKLFNTFLQIKETILLNER